MKSLRTIALVALAAAFACASCAPQQQEQGNPTIETILARKSVRSYTEQKLSEEQIQTLLKAAMAAPSGMMHAQCPTCSTKHLRNSIMTA